MTEPTDADAFQPDTIQDFEETPAQRKRRLARERQRRKRQRQRDAALVTPSHAEHQHIKNDPASQDELSEPNELSELDRRILERQARKRLHLDYVTKESPAKAFRRQATQADALADLLGIPPHMRHNLAQTRESSEEN